MDFYWAEIKNAMVKGYDSRIYIGRLGTFHARPWKIDEIIAEKEHLKNNLNPLNFATFARIKSLEEKIYILNKYKDHDAERALDKRQHRKQRFGDDYKTPEEYKEYLRGLKEQDIQKT